MKHPSTDTSWIVQPLEQPADRFRSVFGRDPSETDIKRHERARVLLGLGIAGSKARIAHVIAVR
jgi:hypothetical protein